ncbi:hypothetical protein DFJ73DRAFT_172251 [Zopfochytrium polystomum]|nr:hypothetical protein DFJ73DRAFT_172251 [Zopfochytrium polystomum]
MDSSGPAAVAATNSDAAADALAHSATTAPLPSPVQQHPSSPPPSPPPSFTSPTNPPPSSSPTATPPSPTAPPSPAAHQPPPPAHHLTTTPLLPTTHAIPRIYTSAQPNSSLLSASIPQFDALYASTHPSLASRVAGERWRRTVEGLNRRVRAGHGVREGEAESSSVGRRRGAAGRVGRAVGGAVAVWAGWWPGGGGRAGEEMMQEIARFLDDENGAVYEPAGFRILHPERTGFLHLEVVQFR